MSFSGLSPISLSSFSKLWPYLVGQTEPEILRLVESQIVIGLKILFLISNINIYLNLLLIMLSNHCNSTRVQSDEFMQIKLEKVNNSMLCDLHYGGFKLEINRKQYNSNELFLSLWIKINFKSSQTFSHSHNLDSMSEENNIVLNFGSFKS